MENEFVTYKQALALKELGFDEECFKYIYIGDTGNGYDHYIEVEPSKAKKYNEDNLCISQPLKKQVFRWFREKYQLEGIIERSGLRLWFKFEIYELYKDSKLMRCAKLEFNTYEEAENACIDKLIELAKQQADGK